MSASDDPSNPSTYSGESQTTDKDTLDAITFTDHERIEELKSYTPTLINNPQQIHGYLSEKDLELANLEADKLALIAKMSRGRTNIRNYYDEQMTTYQAHRELNRSVNGFERSEVTTSRRTSTNYNVPVKPPGAIDRFLSKVGRRKQV